MARLDKAGSLQRELEVAKRLAQEAGTLILRHLTGPLVVGHKEHGEVVTPADREANNLIRSGLGLVFPDDAIYSEETSDSLERLSHSRVWIVDPLDGTSNFIERRNEFSVSIGLSVEGKAVLGVVYNPSRNELFAGGNGLGVSLNSLPAKVSDTTDLYRARLLVSRKECSKGLAQQFPSLTLIPLASMAYKLARVAAGLEDGVFSKKPRKEWGTCAGVALVLAAGGKATPEWRGDQL
jgi:fructose-1,6-bisphosphatase/inositol monophosphatase family enzyme